MENQKYLQETINDFVKEFENEYNCRVTLINNLNIYDGTESITLLSDKSGELPLMYIKAIEKGLDTKFVMQVNRNYLRFNTEGTSSTIPTKNISAVLDIIKDIAEAIYKGGKLFSCVEKEVRGNKRKEIFSFVIPSNNGYKIICSEKELSVINNIQIVFNSSDVALNTLIFDAVRIKYNNYVNTSLLKDFKQTFNTFVSE